MSDQFDNVKQIFYRFSKPSFEYTDVLYMTYYVGKDPAPGQNCSLLRVAPVIEENLDDILITNAQTVKNDSRAKLPDADVLYEPKL